MVGRCMGLTKCHHVAALRAMCVGPVRIRAQRRETLGDERVGGWANAALREGRVVDERVTCMARGRAYPWLDVVKAVLSSISPSPCVLPHRCQALSFLLLHKVQSSPMSWVISVRTLPMHRHQTSFFLR